MTVFAEYLRLYFLLQILYKVVFISSPYPFLFLSSYALYVDTRRNTNAVIIPALFYANITLFISIDLLMVMSTISLSPIECNRIHVFVFIVIEFIFQRLSSTQPFFSMLSFSQLKNYIITI